MLLAAYVVAGFAVAGVYAAGMLRGRRDRYHRIGLLIPLTVGAVAIPLQIVMGDFIARYVFQSEPAKFAAIETLPHTRDPRARDARRRPDRRQGALRDPDPERCLAAVRVQPEHEGRRARRDPRGGAPARRAGLDRAPGVRRHGRHGIRPRRARAVVRAVVVAHRAGNPAPWFLRATAISGVVASSRWNAAGSSPRSGGNPGPSSGLLLTRDAVQTSGNLWPLFAGAVVDLRRRHRRRGLRAAGAAASLGRRREGRTAPVRARTDEPDDDW